MNIYNFPYPHVIQENFTSFSQNQLLDNFPSLDLFGTTIRMDGDLSTHDANFKEFLSMNTIYNKIIKDLSSKVFIKNLMENFNNYIQFELDRNELLHDPRNLEIIEENLEGRSGSALKEFDSPKIFSRIDIGYAGLGYGIKNGGKGVHTDNKRRIFSCLLYLNSPEEMVGGEHRLYSMSKSYNLNIEKTIPIKSNLFVASLQNNYALHDVNPITKIVGYRKAIYIGVSCTNDIWKKISDTKHSKLTQNRYNPSLIERALQKIRW